MIEAVILGVPAAALIWFIVSLISFLKTDKSNCEKYSRRKKWLIISAIPAGLLLICVIALMIIIMLSISHM